MPARLRHRVMAFALRCAQQCIDFSNDMSRLVLRKLEACLDHVAGTQQPHAGGWIGGQSCAGATTIRHVECFNVCINARVRCCLTRFFFACRGGPCQHWHPVLCGLACLCAPAPMHSCRHGQAAGAQHQSYWVAAGNISGSMLADLGKACEAAGLGCQALLHRQLNKWLPGISVEAAGAHPPHTHVLEWRHEGLQGVAKLRQCSETRMVY